MKTLTRAVAIGLLALAASVLGTKIHDVRAATATSPITVSATTVNACTISTTPLAFGNYDPTAATPGLGTATVTTTCTPSAVASISMDAGTNALGATNYSARAMKLTSLLPYQVYTDAARTLIWGDGTAGGSHVTPITGTGSAIVTTAYGSIPARQSVSAGVYTDTITVTVTF